MSKQQRIDPRVFKVGLRALIEQGKGKAMSERVLLKAIMLHDYADAGIAIVGGDAKEAVCHEVVDVAADVPAEVRERLHPGACVLHISAAADAVEWWTKECPYVLVHYKDIIWSVTPAEVQ